MAANSTKSIKSQLFYVSAATTATKVAAVVSASGFSSPASQINISTWDDLSDVFVKGRSQSGTVTVPVIFDATDHAVVEALRISGEVKEFLLVGPVISTGAALATPTVVGSSFTTPTTAESIEFNAYVADFSLDMADNDVWRGTITLQMSGDRVITAIA